MNVDLLGGTYTRIYIYIHIILYYTCMILYDNQVALVEWLGPFQVTSG